MSGLELHEAVMPSGSTDRRVTMRTAHRAMTVRHAQCAMTVRRAQRAMTVRLMSSPVMARRRIQARVGGGVIQWWSRRVHLPQGIGAVILGPASRALPRRRGAR